MEMNGAVPIRRLAPIMHSRIPFHALDSAGGRVDQSTLVAAGLVADGICGDAEGEVEGESCGVGMSASGGGGGGENLKVFDFAVEGCGSLDTIAGFIATRVTGDEEWLSGVQAEL